MLWVLAGVLLLGEVVAGAELDKDVKTALIGALSGERKMLTEAVIRLGAYEHISAYKEGIPAGVGEAGEHLLNCSMRRGGDFVRAEKRISTVDPRLRSSICRVLKLYPLYEARKLIAQEGYNAFTSAFNLFSRYASLIATLNLPAVVESVYGGLLGSVEKKPPGVWSRKLAHIVAEFSLDEHSLRRKTEKIKGKLERFRREQALELSRKLLERGDPDGARFFLERSKKNKHYRRLKRMIEEESSVAKLCRFREEPLSLSEEVAYRELLRSLLSKDRDEVSKSVQSFLSKSPPAYIDDTLYARALSRDLTSYRAKFSASSHPRARQFLRNKKLNPLRGFEEEMRKRRKEKWRFVFLGERPGAPPRSIAMRVLYAIYIPGTLVRGIATGFVDPCPIEPTVDYGRRALESLGRKEQGRKIANILSKMYESAGRYQEAMDVLREASIEASSRIARLRRKLGHSLLLRAYGLREAGLEQKARSAFRYIVVNYPDTPSGSIAIREIGQRVEEREKEPPAQFPLPFGIELKGGIGASGLTGYPRLRPRPYESADAWLY